MFKKLLSKYLDTNKKILDRLEKTVEEINTLEPEMKKLKRTDFKKETEKLKKKVKTDEDLAKVLPRAYALAREAAWRELGMRAYDVQLMAAIAIFEGNVAEQKTGEGKTLSAVFPLYLRALIGKGVHLVTVNDYLARRDAGWNAPVYHLLGLSVGAIVQEQNSFIYDPEYNDTSHGDERLAHLKPTTRKAAYEADITYGTNNEFGFDYLRDNMVQSLQQKVQRGHYFVIVDEVDSILIDEARTPLIISAPDTDPTDKYYKFAEMITKLNPDTDYIIDEKVRSANLTEHGITRVEKIMGVDNLYEKDWEAIHHIENALKAKTLFLKDRDYVVKDGQVTIVDEFTGRLMVGRRWSDGMHQAVEAKEGVEIQQESKTMATISFQNYFRMYEHLSGMTATASTEAEEFQEIYKLNVVVVPTNDPMIRKDHQDVVYKTLRAKYTKIAEEIQKESEKGRPVLVGTTSIEKNEIVSSYLKKKKISHNVLNAKNHEKEATIIAEAGKPGAVTVATNMAGRGVDIVLGGAKPDRGDGVTDKKYKSTKDYKSWKKRHDEVVGAGGLHVIGTERHESRRIDNQLRGRSGRQGDPGSSRFFLSLEDDLMRIFGGEQIGAIMNRFNLPEDQPIENKLVSRAIEQAQVKVEGFHFDSRKRVVEYDDVANQQRDIIYKLRDKILIEGSIKDEVIDKLNDHIEKLVVNSTLGVDGGVDKEKILAGVLEAIPLDERDRDQMKNRLEKIDDDEKVKAFLFKLVNDVHSLREKQVGEKIMRQIEKFAYLGSIDNKWVDHIDHIDGLRQGMGLRGYAQRDPVAEFKNEAYTLFETLLDRIDDELVRRIFRVGVRMQRPEIPLDMARTNVDQRDNIGLAGGAEVAAKAGEPAFAKVSSGSNPNQVQQSSPNASDGRKRVGRNDPCWCGSGKKWKKCHYPQVG
ncbi:preprotein translocase subunit SecA [Candidatus Woesebacteria bacterium]|nr:preprotein translocase subunit SecA [Candidatus Woesebacteria bacterium]